MTSLTIDDATLSAAEQLLGVRYTDAERAQMRDNLAEQVELAVRRRTVKLPNALPPAALFDPRLPGFTMPAQSALNIRAVPPRCPRWTRTSPLRPCGISRPGLPAANSVPP